MLFTQQYGCWMKIVYYIIVIYVVITVNYCKCMLLLFSPLKWYLYVHWILDFKSILLLSLWPFNGSGSAYIQMVIAEG